MAEKIKKGDFIEVDYTGRIKETGEVFDTTIEIVAKQHSLYNPEAKYGKLIICVGEGHLVKGIDSQLEGKELDKKYTFDITPEEGFGKKTAKLIQLISTSKFRKEGIMPVPGLQINIDGMMGTVKTVAGGRTVVDFNHPLSGRDLVYDVEAKRIITDDKEKLSALIDIMNLKGFTPELADGKATLSAKQEVPAELKKLIEEEARRLIPGIKELVFSVEKAAEAEKTKV